MRDRFAPTPKSTPTKTDADQSHCDAKSDVTSCMSELNIASSSALKVKGDGDRKSNPDELDLARLLCIDLDPPSSPPPEEKHSDRKSETSDLESGSDVTEFSEDLPPSSQHGLQELLAGLKGLKREKSARKTRTRKRKRESDVFEEEYHEGEDGDGQIVQPDLFDLLF